MIHRLARSPLRKWPQMCRRHTLAMAYLLVVGVDSVEIAIVQSTTRDVLKLLSAEYYLTLTSRRHIPTRRSELAANNIPEDSVVDGNTFHAYSIAATIAILKTQG